MFDENTKQADISGELLNNLYLSQLPYIFEQLTA